MIRFPDIDPEIFSISILGYELAVRWYALAYISGFLIAVFIMKVVLKKEYLWKNNEPPMEDRDVDSLISYLIVGVIFGGRLGYVLFYNFEYFLIQPLAILRVWDGGMSFHGGFLGVIVAALFFCIKNNIQILPAADLIATSTPPGLFLGRLSNFINNELWGRPTLVPWGVIFPGERAQNCPQFEGPCARHPTQLYEAILEGPLLLALIFIIIRLRGLKNSGFVTGVFSFGYGLARFFLEYYRVPDPQFISIENPIGYAYWFGEFGVTMGQALSMPMIVIGLLLIITRSVWRS